MESVRVCSAKSELNVNKDKAGKSARVGNQYITKVKVSRPQTQ